MTEALKLEVKEAEVSEYHNDPAVLFVLTAQSADSFLAFTRKNMNKTMLFRVDGRDMIKPPRIVQEIPGGRGVLSTSNMDEAIALAERLNSGNADFEVEATREWRISVISTQTVYLGRVEATDEESAIKAAIAELGINKAHQLRLIAQPVE